MPILWATVIPEGEEAPRNRAPREGERERDTLAERRARRAWLGDAALLRRAEAAEASVRTLESHLSDLRRQQVEIERTRESLTAQLAERELELRRVKQREYAEQQLRVEAEEASVRARRGHRAELERWQRRAEQAEAAAQYAEGQRDALAARLVAVNDSCERLREGVGTLQRVAAELRDTFEREQRASRLRIRELEGVVERTRVRPSQAPADPASGPGAEVEDAQRREQMADALAAAVARLRERAGVLGEPQNERPLAGAPTEESTQRRPPAPATPARQTPPPERVMEPQTEGSPAERSSVGDSSTERSSVEGSPVERSSTEVPTVIVVPRLFATRGRSARRLAPAVRRVAVRLARWADRAQDRSR